jgi:hypothetical protein
MAIYADENAVANFNRAFHQVTIEQSMPWADDIAELIDDLAGEKLPAALIEAVLKPRRARHAERRATLAAQATARELVAELKARVNELDAGQLAELEQAAARRAHAAGTFGIPSHTPGRGMGFGLALRESRPRCQVRQLTVLSATSSSLTRAKIRTQSRGHWPWSWRAAGSACGSTNPSWLWAIRSGSKSMAGSSTRAWESSFPAQRSSRRNGAERAGRSHGTGDDR